MTPEQRAKNYFCGGQEPVTPYERGIVETVARLIREALYDAQVARDPYDDTQEG